jgi:transposase
VTEHDVLVGFRLRLFTLAEELGNVSAACRAMGVDRSTYYRLKRRVDRWGLEAPNVRERRRPRMPNQIGPHLEQRIIAFALGHPGYGPRRISAELAREKWGDIRISEHGVWRVLVRVGLNTRAKRLALIARHRDPYERRPELPPPARHIDATEPGEQVQLDCVSSAGCPAPEERSGNTPRSTSPPRSPGPNCTPPSATHAHGTRANCCTASRASSPQPAGSSKKSRRITARNSAPSTSATASNTSARGSASSGPGGPTATAASNACSSPSSRNAGARRLPARSCPR